VFTLRRLPETLRIQRSPTADLPANLDQAWLLLRELAYAAFFQHGRGVAHLILFRFGIRAKHFSSRNLGFDSHLSRCAQPSLFAYLALLYSTGGPRCFSW
jgi:hypothetical protein